MPDYADFLHFFYVKIWQRGVTRVEGLLESGSSQPLIIFVGITVIHRVDMSASVNEKPHVNDLPPPPL